MQNMFRMYFENTIRMNVKMVQNEQKKAFNFAVKLGIFNKWKLQIESETMVNQNWKQRRK